MNRLPNRASTNFRKVLIVVILGFFFCPVAATFTFAQEASAPWTADAIVLPQKEQAPVYRQHNPAAVFSIRNNIAWDATGTPNLSLELALGQHASIGLAFGLKPWDRFFPWDKSLVQKWRHMAVVPEFRYYLKQASRGHFFGANLLYLHYNAGSIRFPLNLYPGVADQRVQGDLFGGGLFYGYAFPLGAHWRIEALLGASGGWYNDIAYECPNCGRVIGPRHGAALLPNLGVNIVYTINKKNE